MCFEAAISGAADHIEQGVHRKRKPRARP
jgi:hypothetical protein